MSELKANFHRKIRSFVLREGRMTPGQSRAMADAWPKYGLSADCQYTDWQAVFGNNHPVVIEIGFGMGEALVLQAKAAPEVNFIGIEVHRPGVGKFLHQVLAQGLTNCRVFNADAVEVLKRCVPTASLDKVNIFFPDPWHKKRHHKRRLVQSAFVDLICQKLKPGGILHCATDWEDYAMHMHKILNQAAALQNTEERFAARPLSRPLTKFENRGLKLGHGVWDLVFKRQTCQP